MSSSACAPQAAPAAPPHRVTFNTNTFHQGGGVGELERFVAPAAAAAPFGKPPPTALNLRNGGSAASAAAEAPKKSCLKAPRTHNNNQAGSLGSSSPSTFLNGSQHNVKKRAKRALEHEEEEGKQLKL